MPNMMEDIKHIPPWLLVAGVGGIGAVILLTRRRGVGGVTTVPMASVTATPAGALQASGLAGGPTADSLQSLSTLPQPAGPSTAPPTPVDLTPGASPWARLFSGAQVGAYNGSIDNAPQAMSQQLSGYAAEFAGQAGYAPWAAQEAQFGSGGPLAGNQAARDAWTQQGLGYLAKDTALHSPPAGSGGGGADLSEVLPHGFNTTMTPDVLAGWSDWMGGRLPRAGLDDTQRYVARRTSRELSARHTSMVDGAVSGLLGGF